MNKILLTILTCFAVTNVYAHCDGCGTESKHKHGTLKGNVKYEGKVPKPKSLRLDADPFCGSSHDGKVFSESFVIDENMNLKNVLVWLKDVAYSGEITQEPAILDQKGCLYTPHVLGVMKGQTVLIKNSDNTLHNIHSMEEKNDQFNYAMPSVVKEKKTIFNETEEPFYIKCDVHPWMKSWVLVEDHPYFAVTDEQGNFSIENIPPGQYEVIAWQEKFKMKRSILKTIVIKDSSETVQDFVFVKPSKK